MTIGKYKGKLTGENSMFRELHKFFHAKDVIIADRAYAGWFDIALCVQRGIDIVTRKHHNRKADFRAGTTSFEKRSRLLRPRKAFCLIKSASKVRYKL